VLTCVGNDDDLAEVVLGDAGALAAMAPGAARRHTTVSPAIARRIAGAARGSACSRSTRRSRAGRPGPRTASWRSCAAARPRRWPPRSRARGLRGAHRPRRRGGAGQACKAVNQICIAGVLAGLSEGVRFAQGAGLDLDKVFEAISGGAAQSWQMDNRWSTMTQDQFDFGFADRLDAQGPRDRARRSAAHGVELPVTALVDGY
jgi:3-hydroxyisobutyrate dehydrogenase